MKRASRILTFTLLGFYILVSSLAFPFGLAHAKFTPDTQDSTHSCPWFWQVKSSVGLPTCLPSVTPNWIYLKYAAPTQSSCETFHQPTFPIRGPPTPPSSFDSLTS